MRIGVCNNMDHYKCKSPSPSDRCLSCPFCEHELDRKMLEYFKTFVEPFLDEDGKFSSKAPTIAADQDRLQKTASRGRTVIPSQTQGNSREFICKFGERVKRCELKCARIGYMLLALSSKPVTLRNSSAFKRFLRALHAELQTQADIVRLDHFNLLDVGPSKLCKLFSGKINLMLRRCHEAKKRLAAIEKRRMDVDVPVLHAHAHAENM